MRGGEKRRFLPGGKGIVDTNFFSFLFLEMEFERGCGIYHCVMAWF